MPALRLFWANMAQLPAQPDPDLELGGAFWQPY